MELFCIVDRSKVQCIINSREFQFAIVCGILLFLLNRFIPQIKVWRLTPPHLPRQFFLTIELARVLGLVASCIAGPWAGLIIALFAGNPTLPFPEVDVVVKAIQFMAVGYTHRKFQSPWNIIALPFGILVSLPIHPTLVQYFLFKQVVVYLFWVNNIMFQALVTLGLYLIVRLLAPQLFEWANPGVRYKLNLPSPSRRKHKKLI